MLYNSRGHEAPEKEAKLPHPEAVDALSFPRFSGISTFMRLPHITDASELDIALIGIPMTAAPPTVRVRASVRATFVSNLPSFDRGIPPSTSIPFQDGVSQTSVTSPSTLFPSKTLSVASQIS
jgi:hypothetical protein